MLLPLSRLREWPGRTNVIARRDRWRAVRSLTLRLQEEYWPKQRTSDGRCYKALPTRDSPRCGGVGAILRGLGYQLALEPI